MDMSVEVDMEFAGRKLTIETGRLAKQANGSVLVKYGNAVLLVAATSSREPAEEVDFFPLIVDFEEKLYAVGKIPGGFPRREGRPSEKAILTGRCIDRSIRPLFPEGLRNEVQIVATCLSVPPDNAPDIGTMGILGASSALCISDIPFLGPVGALRIGRLQDQFVVNPTFTQLSQSDFDLVVAGTRDFIVMIEAAAKEVEEEAVREAVEFGRDFIISTIELQEKLIERVAKPTGNYPLFQIEENIFQTVKSAFGEEIDRAAKIEDKTERDKALQSLQKRAAEQFLPQFPEKELHILGTVNQLIKEAVRKLILQEKVRPDGRGLTEIRPISCEVGLLPRVHGSGLFTRGQTQVLTIATLGAVGEAQILDGLTEEESKRFMHQYNFPPYSTSEVQPLRAPKRREIGHGALAEKALEAVLLQDESFPYTIRLVSEVLGSNGSTSMASVCASSLALMDAGIPIKEAVAGISIGLFRDSDQYAILTDLQGIEDSSGEMDFKIAGTRRGITALQLDVKEMGISPEIIRKALSQAKEARLHILDRMAEAIEKPREALSPYAPRIFSLQIPLDKVGGLIGPGGKTIRKIIEKTGVQIDIEDEGWVYITAPNAEAGEIAMKMVQEITYEPRIGEVCLGRVTRILPIGAMVEIAPGKEGLLHISELSTKRVNKVEDVVHSGDQILVKVIGIDNQGRINLTRKGLLGTPKVPVR